MYAEADRCLRSPTARRSARRCASSSQNDERVFLMGEDIGAYGGSYAVTKGFLEEFGERRVKDTPIAESVVVGAGHRRGDGRPQADGRTDDDQLQPAGDRPDREQRLEAALHVERPDQRAARDPHGGRRREPARRAALAQPRELVRARPRPQGRRAGDTVRRQGPAHDGVRRREPRHLHRAHGALRLEGRGAGRAVPDPVRARPDVMREGADVTLIGYSGSVHQAHRAADAARGGGHRVPKC